MFARILMPTTARGPDASAAHGRRPKGETRAMTTTTTAGRHAVLSPLGAANLRWSGGFWGAQLERTREVTVPSIWRSLSDPEVSPGWGNFLIAAGRDEGEHQGPPFLDGDMYKWLEAAISLLETAPDPELEAVADEVGGLIPPIQ